MPTDADELLAEIDEARARVGMRRPATLLFLALASASSVGKPSAERSRPSAERRLRGGGGLAFDAALFDFDGTLAQSEGLHRLAFGEVLGITFEEEYWETKVVGTSPAKVMTDHLPEGRLAPGETIDDLLAQRSAIFEQWVDEGKLEATAGAAELLEVLAEQGVRCAVVSSGSRAYILKALRNLDLERFFEFIVAGDDEVMRDGCPQAGAPHHKPHPFPYLHAAARLGVLPERCVAFEDSLSGIKSAQAAGMLVVGVKNRANAGLPTVPDEEPCATTGIQPLADLVDDFDALDRRFLF